MRQTPRNRHAGNPFDKGARRLLKFSLDSRRLDLSHDLAMELVDLLLVAAERTEVRSMLGYAESLDFLGDLIASGTVDFLSHVTGRKEIGSW